MNTFERHCKGQVSQGCFVLGYDMIVLVTKIYVAKQSNMHGLGDTEASNMLETKREMDQSQDDRGSRRCVCEAL